MLYEALLVQHKYELNNEYNARYKKRVEERKIVKCKHKDMFLGSSHCSTFPPSHRRIFTILSAQDFPHKEPPLRIWQIQTRSIQLLSPTNNLYTRGKAQQLSPLYLEEWALSQTTITSTLRGIGTKPKLQPYSPLYLEG